MRLIVVLMIAAGSYLCMLEVRKLMNTPKQPVGHLSFRLKTEPGQQADSAYEDMLKQLHAYNATWQPFPSLHCDWDLTVTPGENNFLVEADGHGCGSDSWKIRKDFLQKPRSVFDFLTTEIVNNEGH